MNQKGKYRSIIMKTVSGVDRDDLERSSAELKREIDKSEREINQ